MGSEDPRAEHGGTRQVAQEEGLLRAEDVHMVEAVVVDDTHEVDEVRPAHTVSALEPEMVTPLPNSSSVTSLNATAFFAAA